MGRWRLWLRIIGWLLRAPIALTRGLSGLIVRLGGTWILLRHDAFPCRGCGATVSLVGRWRCGWCDYAFDGFAFARCEVCGAVPPFIECQVCGVGIKNPMLFP
jgi:hypothetical protein